MAESDPVWSVNIKRSLVSHFVNYAIGSDRQKGFYLEVSRDDDICLLVFFFDTLHCISDLHFRMMSQVANVLQTIMLRLTPFCQSGKRNEILMLVTSVMEDTQLNMEFQFIPIQL